MLQIKKLLYEEGFTIAAARQKLGMGDGQGALDDLFDVAPADEPPRLVERPRPVASVLNSVTSRLEEILDIMAATDRRLQDKR